MTSLIDTIKSIRQEKKITFPEKYYKSSDNKTIMGELSFKEIILLDYRETGEESNEAGSNPREYKGLRKANEDIIKSLLKDYKNMFRFLHSGIIVSLQNTKSVDERTIQYANCCLTNGNQTRFIILILTLLKLISKSLKDVKQPEFDQFIKQNFKDTSSWKNVLKYLRFKRVKEIIDFLKKNGKYKTSFDNMDLNDFLNSRIRIQINLIDNISSDVTRLDTYDIGTLIAEANNNTQNVKVDDIFGTKNRRELNEKIFTDFITKHRNQIEIEFRFDEIVDNVKKVHILRLLRPVVATGILTNQNDIYKLTNKRTPIYALFGKLLKKNNATKTITAISKLIPLLFDIRQKYIEPYLNDFESKFVREYEKKAISGDLNWTIIKNKINKAKDNDTALNNLIRSNIKYNIDHIIPVLIFRIKLLFIDQDGRVDLSIPEKNRPSFFKALIESIYRNYIEMRLKGLPTSLTTALRDESFYRFAEETYTALKHSLKLKETNYIQENAYIIS
ncbi:MAG: hypothetical protein V1709_06720 [Planctomycetota bacterium]